MYNTKKNILRASLIAIIVIVVVLSTLYFTQDNTQKSPSLSPNSNDSQSSFCTNREKTAVVCKNDIICQCEKGVFTNPIFFANAKGECPTGCNTLTPSSLEGTLGTCNIAVLMASDVPACHPGCQGTEVSKKSQEVTNECCTVILEGPCSLSE